MAKANTENRSSRRPQKKYRIPLSSGSAWQRATHGTEDGGTPPGIPGDTNHHGVTIPGCNHALYGSYEWTQAASSHCPGFPRTWCERCQALTSFRRCTWSRSSRQEDRLAGLQHSIALPFTIVPCVVVSRPNLLPPECPSLLARIRQNATSGLERTNRDGHSYERPTRLPPLPPLSPGSREYVVPAV